MTFCAMGPPILAAGIEQLIVLALVGIGIAIKNFFENRAKKNQPTGTFGGPATPPTRPTAPPPPLQQQAPPPQPRRAATPEEEKMRKFFEALGLPTDAIPPAPVAPSPKPPPVVPKAPPKIPVKAAPPPLARAPQTSTGTSTYDFQSLDSDKSPQVLAGDMHRVDPKFDHAALTADFRDASSLQYRPTDVHVDVRPDLIGRSPNVSNVEKAHRPVALFPGGDLAQILRTDRHALRRAFVLGEVLGKPVALRD